MEKDPENIWYLAGPMFQYNEDVKALARQAGLKIIDANVTVGRVNAAEDVPEVTIKAEYIDQGAVERVATAAELMAVRSDLLVAHDDLQQRERELASEKDRVAEQARANEAEAQRLRIEAASLQAAKDAAVAATQSQVAPATATAEKPAKAAKA